MAKALKKILNDAKEGCIYLNLGTNLRSNRLPINRCNMFLKTFVGLPCELLWKFESDQLANKPDNVVIRKWLPQQEVLPHSNVQLFLRDLLRDLPHKAMDNVVCWIERVIRHKGPPHLRNKSRGTPWYQDRMSDVMAIAFGRIGMCYCGDYSLQRAFGPSQDQYKCL
ncbi:UDP-glucuronosyltransferase 2B14-like [Harpegnathos saltator]|uniref:UDP-glucuronosyltransferase 2B14-like n=1 Tax=Harpegnathos saltator TaxID=610380 RepID=UPI000DBEDDF7|nr:UDP-glucuronosyltransferase 2B14-like [Harpegnathos saltator]